MNTKKLAAAVSSAAAAAVTAANMQVLSAIDMDYTNDGRVDAFDLIAARQNASQEELLRLNDFVLGKPVTSDGYTLIWSDEFDGSSLDKDKWSYELGNWKTDSKGNYITNGWGNNEQEFYTDSNATVSGGVLTIAARKESYTDPVQGSYDYTSARLSSQYKFSTCGGRIEVRARCDSGKSLWPAIWMLPEDSVYGGWAASGEIDIMEGWGSTPEKICGTIHFGDVWPNNTYLTSDYTFAEGDSTENWHTYAVEWDSDEMRWFVDDDLYSTQSEWYSVNRAYPAPFDQDFYLLLNLAVGGHFDGIDGIYADPATFAAGEKHFDIDYVRVYSKNGSSFAPTPQTSQALSLYREGAEAGLTNKDGCTVAHIATLGEKPYSVMGLIESKHVTAGEERTLSFTAQSTVERLITVTVEDAQYTRYLDETITLSTEPKLFSFTVPFSADMDADIKFLMGKVSNDTPNTEHDITLSEIQWK